MVVRQAAETKLTTLAREYDLVAVISGIAVAFVILVILRLIHYLTGDPFSPSSGWVGSVVGASLMASSLARRRALRDSRDDRICLSVV